MKCPECDGEMTDKQTIELLEKKVERLEGELVAEKLKPTPYIPYVPYEPYKPWYEPYKPWTWISSGTDINADDPTGLRTTWG